MPLPFSDALGVQINVKHDREKSRNTFRRFRRQRVCNARISAIARYRIIRAKRFSSNSDYARAVRTPSAGPFARISRRREPIGAKTPKTGHAICADETAGEFERLSVSFRNGRRGFHPPRPEKSPRKSSSIFEVSDPRAYHTRRVPGPGAG